MKICFILEGSYPYVRGGVSTWVDSFIRSIPEHEIILWTINDLEDKRGNFKYEIPENVIDIRENFLSTSIKLKVADNPNLKFTDEEKEVINQLLRRGDPDWRILLKIFEKSNKPVEFFLSESFLEMLKDLCDEEFPYAGFKDLFWTVRSIYLPLLFLLGQEIPEADIYHSPSTGYAGVLGAIAAQKYDKPFVLTEHGIYTREREEELLRSDWIAPYFKDLWISAFYMFSKFAYQSAQRVTGLYKKANMMQVELGCDPGKLEQIGNGLRTNRFSQIPFKKEDGWLDIGAIVRFAPIKDIKTMIYTFARLKEEIKNVRLHILGGIEDQDYYQECVELIDFLDVPDIKIPGNVDVVKYLENIDFTILTSISEGQPFAVLESMAAKRPVIATDVGSCRELIEGGGEDNLGDAGICVPPMHQSALLQALVEMCTDKNMRKSMGKVGLERVTKFHEHETMVNNYLDVYDKAIRIWQESDLN